MDKKKRFPRLVIVISAIGIIILVCSSWYIWDYEIFPKPQLNPPPSWNNIVPGQTPMETVSSIMGEPDYRETRKPGFLVYVYSERPELDWRRVEIWIDTKRKLVVAILRDLQKLDTVNKIYLDEFVSRYWRPDAIKWTLFPRSRYLVWAEDGVAVSANCDVKKYGWNELRVHEILLFEPMGVRQFLRTDWPYPNIGSGWNTVSTRELGMEDNPDTYPLDPYDWMHMPTPQP